MLVVCVALLPAPAWTQETASAAVQEVVVTASALGESAGADAASAGVAGADQLANRPWSVPGSCWRSFPVSSSPSTRRRQSEPVFPARLRSRSRHGLRHLGRRCAGQPADARTRPGLHGPEFRHPRAGRGSQRIARVPTTPTRAISPPPECRPPAQEAPRLRPAVGECGRVRLSALRNESAPVADIHFHPAEPRTLRASVVRRF